MPILYVPNDPEARNASPPRTIAPVRARRRGATDFDFGTLPERRVWPVESEPFRVWQCRETLLRALGTWERIAGPLAHWQGSPARRKLRVGVDEGSDLNAYYDRASLSYFHHRSPVSGRTRYFAASADVAAHEAGHAFLDAVRPELWDSNYPEPNAFHEAFGDCVAMLTALDDAPTRRHLLARDPGLTKTNFVETLIESLANGLRDVDPSHNGAAPRRGRNTYRWALPGTLPDDGGPGVLINEVHSFAQVFTGCFYDLVRTLFRAQRTKGANALRDCSRRAGRLLVHGAIKAPHTPRFFQAVGRAMTLEDAQLYRGRHHEAIRLAFRRHGILLGSVAAIAPRAALSGAPPRIGRGGVAVSRETLRDLRTHLGVPPRAALRMRSFALGGKPVAEAVHERAVPLAGLEPRLANVVAIGAEPALIGETNRRAALLGALPDKEATNDEVRAFVASLVRRDAIAYGVAAKRRARGGGAVASLGGAATHAVVRVDGRPTLKRMRFACGCGSHRLAR
jgi:hypothetical protein